MTRSSPVRRNDISRSSISNVSSPTRSLSPVPLPGVVNIRARLLLTSGMKWLHGGVPLRNHRLPISEPDAGVVTSLAMDEDWIVTGLSDSRIHIFSRRKGVLNRTLVGCQGGVWTVWLVEKKPWSLPSPRKKSTTSGSAGWGQATSLVVSGGCDKIVRVWDVESGCEDSFFTLSVF
jgi:WD40 repeat protein